MTLSLVLPFFNVHFLSIGYNPVNEQLQGVVEIGVPFATFLSQYDGIVTADGSNLNINWWSIISLIYVIGLCVTMIWKLIQLFTLHRQIHKGVLWVERQGGVTVYCHANSIAPFSWFNFIAISEEDYKYNAEEILSHEMCHVQNHHSIDILLVNIVQVVQWCNPLSWILANSLRDVHEYEADDAVLRSGVNVHQYQSLLIKKAVGSSSYAFANSFNHSLLKKRITMMLQKKSNPWMRSKALYILPVASVALSVFATPELHDQIETVNDQIVTPVESSIRNRGKVTKVLQNLQVPKVKTVADNSISRPESPDDPVLLVAEKLPEYKGGMAELMNFFARNIRYPIEAQKIGVAGRVIVTFVVEKDGTISEVKSESNSAMPKKEDYQTSNVTVADNNSTDKDETKPTFEEVEVVAKLLEKEAMRVVKLTDGNWIPGEQKGEKVRVKFGFPITFRMQ